jgi:hypothetical protein
MLDMVMLVGPVVKIPPPVCESMQRCSVSVPIHAHHSMGLWSTVTSIWFIVGVITYGPSFTHPACSVVRQSRGVRHGKRSMVVDGPSLGAVSIQVVLHVQIARA